MDKESTLKAAEKYFNDSNEVDAHAPDGAGWITPKDLAERINKSLSTCTRTLNKQATAGIMEKFKWGHQTWYREILKKKGKK